MKRALIIVDVQNDFCSGGTLVVPEGERVVPIINGLIASNKFNLIIGTKDWHPADHKSFASNWQGKKVFDIVKLNDSDQILWPDHCRRLSEGAQFHPDLNVARFNVIIHKGTNPEVDSYSAFKDNDGTTVTGLWGLLQENMIEEIYICGLATDYCVQATAIDAATISENEDTGEKIIVIEDACRGVALESTAKALVEMKKSGIKIIKSTEIE